MSAYKYAIESLLMERRHLVQQLACRKEEKEGYEMSMKNAGADITKMALRKSELDEAIKALEELEVDQKEAQKGFVVKNVTGFDIHKFARELILPDIIEYLKESRISFSLEGK